MGPNPTTVDPVKAAILINHPAQYVAPGLRLLARQPQVQFRAYYWDAATQGVRDSGFGRHIRWKADLHSGYDWWSPAPEHMGLLRWLAVWRQLTQHQPDVVLSFGWSSPIARLGILFSSVTGTPLLYYGDTNDRTRLAGLHTKLRSLVLRALFSRAAGAISTGDANRDFYLSQGLTAEQIHHGVLPVDIESFSTAATNRPPKQSSGKSPVPLVIGFVGKFIPVKAIDDLIEAVAVLPRDPTWELRLIGDGPLRSHLESLVQERGLADRVRFLGFKNTEELPALMASIDILVLPSRKEARGLVAVEAMAAGATTIVSSATGVWGKDDAVQHGESGVVYTAGDIPALAGSLRQLMADPELRVRLTTAGKARALSLGPQEFAATTAAALAAATRKDHHARHN